MVKRASSSRLGRRRQRMAATSRAATISHVARCIIQTTNPRRGIVELPFTDAICSPWRLPRDRLNCGLNERFGGESAARAPRPLSFCAASSPRALRDLNASKERIYRARCYTTEKARASKGDFGIDEVRRDTEPLFQEREFGEFVQ